MTPNQIREAAEFLMAARAARRREPNLPEALRPKTEAEATAIGGYIMAANTKPIVGWKIGATADAAQKAMGLAGPFVGCLTADMIDGNDVTYKHADLMGPIVESEYAFRMNADLPPKAEAYTRAEVEATVGSLIIGFEIPERRLADDHTLGAYGSLSDHGGTGRYVIGAEFTDWQDKDCANTEVVLTYSGVEKGRGKGAAMMGHPLEALTWFANYLSARGLTLEAGQFVTTGSATGVLPCPEPCVAIADFGPLGQVKATFA
jgi:2-keto-4-pentenoate hydratase